VTPKVQAELKRRHDIIMGKTKGELGPWPFVEPDKRVEARKKELIKELLELKHESR